MFGAFRDAVVFQCNVRTRSQAAAPQSDNCLSFQLILQVTGRSFSAPQIWNGQNKMLKKNKERSILKNKIPPPRTAHVLYSSPYVSAALACSGSRDGYPQTSASQSGIWLPCSRFRKRRAKMRVHAAFPPGIRQARSRHCPPPPHQNHRRPAHPCTSVRSDVRARWFSKSSACTRFRSV